MSLGKYKIYDEILKFLDSHPNKLESDFSKRFLQASPYKNQTKEQKQRIIEKQNEYRRSLEYLVGAGYVEKQRVYIKLTAKGQEKILKGFEQTYLEEEKQKSLVETNLIKTTILAEAQIKDIKRSKIISWIALVVSVIALGSQIFTNYRDYLIDSRENRNTQSPVRKGNVVFEIKDSTNETSKFYHDNNVLNRE